MPATHRGIRVRTGRRFTFLAASISVVLIGTGSGVADDSAPDGTGVPDALNLPAATGPQVTRAVFLDGARAGKRIVAVGERGIVMLSDDEAGTWKQARVPVQVTLTSVAFSDDHTAFAVGHDAVILRSNDSGDTWQVVHSDPALEAPLLDIVFSSPLAGIAVGGGGNLLRTSDGGQTWAGSVVYGADEFDGHLFGLTHTSGALFMAAEAGAIQRSRDDGQTWELLSAGYPGSFFGLTALRSGRLLAFGMLGNARYSDDLGDSWNVVEGDAEKSLLTASELADGRVVLAGLDGIIAISSDGGKTLKDASMAERMRISAMLPLADGQWLILGDRGLQRKALNLH